MPTSTDGDLPIEIEFVADPTEDMNRFFIENVDPFNGIEALPGFEHSADTIEYLNAKAAGYQLPVIDKHVKSTVRPWHPPHPAD